MGWVEEEEEGGGGGGGLVCLFYFRFHFKKIQNNQRITASIKIVLLRPNS